MTLKPKILFSGDTSNRTNWGCRATTSGLRSILSRSFDIVHTIDTMQWKHHIETDYSDYLNRGDIYFGNDKFSSIPAQDVGLGKKAKRSFYSKVRNKLLSGNKTQAIKYRPNDITDFYQVVENILQQKNSCLIQVLHKVDAVVIYD